MVRHRFCLAAVGVLLAALPAAAEPPADATPLSAEALAARIDKLLADRREKAAVTAAPLAPDEMFNRRVWLDVAGRVPPASQVRRFLDDPSPDKRQKLVEDLLDGPGYVNHFANVWRLAWAPESENNFQARFTALGLDAWLRQRLQDNAPYDEVVREILTVKVAQEGRNGDPFRRAREASPYGIFYAKEMKPENLASATSRLFLGIRLECAQCHDHPFAKWKRDQFWSLTAFFGGVQAKSQDGFIQQVRELPDRRELAIPGTERVAQAAFLDGTQPKWEADADSRTTLARWVTSPENTQFSKAAVNRMWAYFFGSGIVEPFDDFKDDNPPSQPEVLDELARQFVLHKFDLKYLIRAITATKAYQMSSSGPDMTADERKNFARMPVRGLTPEQLFDSLAQATGYKDPTNIRIRAYAFNTPRADFLTKFERTDKKTEAATSIPQALALMNSKLVTDLVSVDKGETLPAVADAPFLNTAGKVEALYLAALGRKPGSEELHKLTKYVDEGGPAKDPKKALGDVFWALLNSPEFVLNH